MERILICEYVELDAGPSASQAGNRCLLLAPIRCARLTEIVDVAVVVAGAALTTVALEIRATEVGANLLRGAPEVIDRARFVGEDVTRGDEDTVHSNAFAAIWEPQ